MCQQKQIMLLVIEIINCNAALNFSVSAEYVVEPLFEFDTSIYNNLMTLF